MCIAIAKPMGKEIPNDEILKTCFKNNSDGMGFAFNHNNEVVIKKGYMKIEDFLNAFHKYDKKFNFKNRGVLIHARITTHGGTTPEMCHPFPINEDEGALKKIEYCSPFAVIHNGIISLTSAEATRKKDMSDTAIFVQKYLTKIAKNKDWFSNSSNIELIEELIDSKMAILNGSGKIIKTSGFIEDNGIFYSNSSYKENRYSTKYPYSYYDYWDDYDYDYESYLTTQGYEKIDGGGWFRKDSKNQSTLINDTSERVDLMLLQKDQLLVYSDGTIDEYTEGICFFLDEQGDVYASFDSDDEYKTEIINPLEYFGEGAIYDKSLKQLSFVPTHYTNIYNIDGNYYY